MGIYDAIKAGSSGLQSIDPFEDISPLVTEHDESESFLPVTIDQLTDELGENFVNVPLHYNLLFFTKHMIHIFL